MKANIEKLVTRYNPHRIIDPTGATIQYDFTMYYSEVYCSPQPFESPHGKLEGIVEMRTYGLIIREATSYKGVDSFKEWNTGLITAQQFEINALIYYLCDTKAPNLDKIKLYSKEPEIVAPPPSTNNDALESKEKRRLDAVAKLKAYWSQREQ